jgi:hypothetical protein
MSLKGAGGSPGGTGSFILGFLMMCAGTYLLLQSIVVAQPFGLGTGLYHFIAFGGPVSITSGMLLIPLMIGIGMIFYNARNILGWALAAGSLAALVVGVLVNLRFVMRPMSLFELLGILVLALGGLGLFLRSLKGRPSESLPDSEQD